ncbi:MAG: hypothetical protein OXU66_00285 [Gammaproteobacteria bacterium]|nr:hypothetical protein [Gammaproteobacteria bacterium]MDD9895327.1 hypothetical protein [Gammaproteobacteria bacterium]MDD9957350.1 hypothetical protein [Gammaproteobacteria bacterium]
MALTVLNPTTESPARDFELAPRIQSLAGKTVGFISNGKEGTKGFFTHLENLLLSKYQVAEVIWETKSNYSAPAETEIIERAQAWDLAITGLGD